MKGNKELEDVGEGGIGDPLADFIDSQENPTKLARESNCYEDSFDEGMYTKNREIVLEEMLPSPPKLLFCPHRR